ncbi:tRNA (adenosine(37)-N6)-threonylcarbamoyltransferase complex dimerization subunit type 1 TsaB [Mycoplasma sp. 744]|uniref:tRNA (adenosine(37)-N6)-threonylcarbamoyltransferase complex dimerization subunit type 1 TsaB n=1 Tax=Mycoplasma sp. 744 TaxID=3108531 RepID=UPI002B1D11A2|nr:tRNA (adenosine(37)-N6)-threonylcarbamoyltransferase complex dimerization subunit type 1 TsaB [Mycoplasma sp. 744]MEA4115265.1 tRNA (adenosine(37)-N6)-threonylcarbamoyltransferase complex dimerization subunit type 1 TsaB [Mycoplasma sp. 744]
MHLYLDTANDDFVLAIFDSKFNILKQIILHNYPKKVNLIVEYVEKFLKELKLSINDFKIFYLNIGPGYFTGVRIGLVYLRTIALLTNAQIKTTSTFQILNKQYPEQKTLAINAAGNKFYIWNVQEIFNSSNIEIRLINENKNLLFKIKYEEFINNFSKYLSLFKDNPNIMDIEPYYIKMPQIGQKGK